MRFVVAKTKMFWWPVKVIVPSETVAGETEEQEFEALFEALDDAEAKAVDAAVLASGVTDRVEAEYKVLTRVVKGWRGVVGEDESPLDFTPDNFKAALGFGWTRKALYQAYSNAMSGEAARIKN